MRPGRLLAALSAAFLGVTLLPPQASASVSDDDTPPVIRLAIDPSHGTGAWVGWYRDPVQFSLVASDPGGSGVVRLSYRLTGAQTGERETANPTLAGTIESEGVTTVSVTATDAAGNVGTLTYGIGVDLTRPTGNSVGITAHERLRGSEVRTVTFSCADPGGALVSCTATNDGAPFTSGSPLATSTLGPHTFTLRAVDRVGREYTSTIPYRVASPLTLTSSPSIVGAPTQVRPGTTLRATGGTFEPAAHEVHYRWHVGGELTGTGVTYLVQPRDVGKTITMDMIARHPDHLDTTTPRVGSVEVLPLGFRVDSAPRVTGAAQIGGSLTVADGSVTPQTEPAETRWRVAGNEFATGSSLPITRDLAGKRITCDQVFTRTGYARTTVPCVFPGGADGITVPASTPPWKIVKAARVTGKAKVGKRLRAVLPRLSAPASGHSYQWLRNGKVIKKARTATYQLRRADRGKVVTVRITSTAAGRSALVSVASGVRVRR